MNICVKFFDECTLYLIPCEDVPLEQPGGGGDDQRPQFERRQARQDKPPLQPDRCYKDHTDGSLSKQPQGRDW